MAIVCGVRAGDGLSDFYKATISGDIPGAGFVTVVGYITEECSIRLGQQWNSPFESDTIGSAGMTAKTGDVVQAGTDITSKSLLNSRLVWEGSEPFTFQLQLAFTAYDDALTQVDLPLKYLAMMQAPELNEIAPGGQIPQLMMLDLGRRMKAAVYVRQVEWNQAAPKTKGGHFLYNTVTIECSTDGAVNRSQIPQIFV
jgi:hypothetical protein